MKRADSVDVDTQEDFDLANFLIKQKNTSKKSIVIRNYEINEGKRVFVIAEAGVNHNGDLEKAIALVDLAAEIGADAIKFQTFKAEQVVTEKGDMAEYQKRNLGFEKTQREMLKDLELPENFYPPIMERCKEKQILFLSTPHGGKESVDFLEYLGVPAHKIGSGDLTHYILLDKIARTGKPIILATGMATLDEVKDAVEFIKSKGNHQIIVLHCTSNYPCPPVDVNMAAMKTLMRELDVPVGYSDHTEGLTAAIMATTLGAALYEFHFTLDKNLPGPDHRASANPEEAKERVKAIRQASLMMGNSAKEATVDEKKFTLPIARRSIVAAKNFKKGALISFNDIEAKRPADGLSPIHYEKIIGKTAKKDYKKDEQIRLDDFV
ncbi:N-acetylneuraminate synthase [Candidatus Peregrinibacteria bacterium]|nr:N-acetylneuraminate synthase [Candidatus Peregrinibacteria bacterium]